MAKTDKLWWIEIMHWNILVYYECALRSRTGCKHLKNEKCSSRAGCWIKFLKIFRNRKTSKKLMRYSCPLMHIWRKFKDKEKSWGWGCTYKLYIEVADNLGSDWTLVEHCKGTWIIYIMVARALKANCIIIQISLPFWDVQMNFPFLADLWEDF